MSHCNSLALYSWSGIKTVIIPFDNKKDLAEVPKSVIKKLKIYPIENAKKVLEYSLTKSLNPIKNDESETFSEISGHSNKENESSTITH